MKTGITIAGILLAGSLVAAGFGMQQGGGMMGGMQQGGMHGGMGGHGPLACHLQDLNLTASQQSELQQLQSELRTNLRLEHEENRENHPLKQAYGSGSFNKESFISASNTLHAQTVTLKAEYLERMIGVLDENQKAILATKIQAAEGTPCGKMGKGGRF